MSGIAAARPGVVEQVGLAGLAEQPGRLGAHAADQAADPWRQGVSVQPPGGLGDVDGEVGGAFDRGDDPNAATISRRSDATGAWRARRR